MGVWLSYNPKAPCNCQICGLRSVIPRHKTLSECATAKCECCTTVTGFIRAIRYLKKERLLKPGPVPSWTVRNRLARIIFGAIIAILSGIALALILRWLGLA